VQGISFSGNLFFDPLATGLAAAGDHEPTRPAKEHRRRGTQTPAEQKALRAASLTKVSNDLERMVRERMR
jgi:hypothetical protein